MALSQIDDTIQHRPLWLPHPKLLAFIALLWMLAGAANLLPLLGH